LSAHPDASYRSMPLRTRLADRRPRVAMSALAHNRYKLVLFGLLSIADLVLTLYLPHQGNGRVYESNPLAGWWLARLGSFGLALYKVLCVLLFGTLILTISRLN